MYSTRLDGDGIGVPSSCLLSGLVRRKARRRAKGMMGCCDGSYQLWPPSERARMEGGCYLWHVRSATVCVVEVFSPSKYARLLLGRPDVALLDGDRSVNVATTTSASSQPRTKGMFLPTVDHVLMMAASKSPAHLCNRF